MKRIINGRKYDTETARLVASWDNGHYGEFSYCGEALYRKGTGECFIHGNGGPMSKYRRSCGSNEWCGSEEITPLSEEEARRWAEDAMDGDEYEAEFGEVPE